MLKKILLESLTVLLICISLILLKNFYSQTTVEAIHETPVGQAAQSEVVVEEKAIVDINLATHQELQKIPGVGSVIAKRIIEDRERNGYYQSTIDIIRVKGIGSKTFEKMQSHIVIDKDNLLLYLGY